MSKEKKQPGRGFTVISRIFKLIIALIFVFFLSFFVTLSLKTPHPVDFIISEFFETKDKDKLIDDYEEKQKTLTIEIKDKISDDKSNVRNSNVDKSVRKDDTDNDKTDKTSSTENKINTVKKIDDSSISGKIERIMSIKTAVDEKMKDKKNYVTLDEIPRSLRQAIIAVEDSRFYSHKGFDPESIARAAIVNVESGKIEEGASTITQQLVKNLFLSQEQSFTRKAEELILALDMERNYSKDEILELYLNTIYFGSNFYGVYDAAEGYFGKVPEELTLAESTMLAGLPNAPSLYSPYVDFMLAKKRQLVVIDAMLRANILTEREAEKARIETITLARDEG